MSARFFVRQANSRFAATRLVGSQHLADNGRMDDADQQSGDASDSENSIRARLPFPAEFLDRLSEIISDSHDLQQVYRSFVEPKCVSFRVNTLVTDVTTVSISLADQGLTLTPVDWCEAAFQVPFSQRSLLLQTSEFDHGHISVQTASSFLPVLALNALPGETVLDLAAAPGGKTIHLAQCMRNEGVLSAVEPVRNRFFKLMANLKRHGVQIAKTYQTDGRTVGRKTPERFDKILLDAPCSSESRFRADDADSYAYWSERKIREQSRKQKGLIRSAFQSLRPGGTLVYCTCSFAPEENEAVLADLLKHHGDQIQVQDFTCPAPHVLPGLTHWRGRDWPAEIQYAKRVLPSHELDSFFLCKLVKL